MKKYLALLVLVLSLTGCAGGSMPVYIPTGNPVTDVLVSAAVEEGARFVASQVVPAVLSSVMDDGGAVYSAAAGSVASLGSFSLPGKEKRVSGYGGVVYCGDWD